MVTPRNSKTSAEETVHGFTLEEFAKAQMSIEAELRRLQGSIGSPPEVVCWQRILGLAKTDPVAFYFLRKLILDAASVHAMNPGKYVTAAAGSWEKIAQITLYEAGAAQALFELNRRLSPEALEERIAALSAPVVDSERFQG